VTELSYSAPIYKGSDAIKEGLAAARTALEKFDVYFDHALLDEEERVRFARLFAQQYVRKHPASERSDLFLASADVLKVAVELVPPLALPKPIAALDAIAAAPHDLSILGRLRGGDAIDRAHLCFQVRVFLDHVMNPRRREQAAVRGVMKELGIELPYILEAVTDGAIPGYVRWALHPLVREIGGGLVLLSE
jgi:hypothetical protein